MAVVVPGVMVAWMNEPDAPMDMDEALQTIKRIHDEWEATQGD